MEKLVGGCAARSVATAQNRPPEHIEGDSCLTRQFMIERESVNNGDDDRSDQLHRCAWREVQP